MKLLSMTATFGCLTEETLYLAEGMSLIGAPNGGGKTTWCAFLRAMLYGLDSRQRNRKGFLADKNRYRPWSGAPMEGELRCEHQGKVIRIRRDSSGGQPMGRFSAVYEETNLPVPGLTGENVGEILTGLSKELFDRSVLFRQTDLVVKQSQELEKRIAGLVTAGQEDVSWSEADDRLGTWLRRRRFHKTGLLPQMEGEARALEESLSRTARLRQDLDRTEEALRHLEAERDEWQTRLTQENDQRLAASRQRQEEAAQELSQAGRRVEELQEALRLFQGENAHLVDKRAAQLSRIRKTAKSRRRWLILCTVLLVLLTGGLAALYVLPLVSSDFALPNLSPTVLMAGGAVLWTLLLSGWLVHFFRRHGDKKTTARLERDQGDYETQVEGQVRALEDARLYRDQTSRYAHAVSHIPETISLPAGADLCYETLQKTQEEAAHLRGQLSALGDPVTLEAQLDQLEEALRRTETDYQAIDLAQRVLREADGELHARFSPRLAQLAGEYLSRLTDGAYTGVSLTRSLEVTVRPVGSKKERPLSMLSQGTIDQLYFALRLAVADLFLPSKDACPLILDDALLSYDDARLRLAAKLLSELAGERQILFFTCRRREFSLLEWDNHTQATTLPGF